MFLFFVSFFFFFLHVDHFLFEFVTVLFPLFYVDVLAVRPAGS